MENEDLILLDEQVEEQEQDLTGRSIHTTSADAQVDSLYGRYPSIFTKEAGRIYVML